MMLRNNRSSNTITQLDLYVWELSSSPDEIWIAYTPETYQQIIENLTEAVKTLATNVILEFRSRKPSRTGDFPFVYDDLSTSESIPFSVFEKTCGVKFRWFRCLLIKVQSSLVGPAYSKVAGDIVSLYVSTELFLREVEPSAAGFDITFGAYNAHLAASWLGRQW